MPVSRVTVTLPADLIERIDEASPNRSRFIAEAVERELHRRLREALHCSLGAPHGESLEVAELGLSAYVDALDDDAAVLVDPDAGVSVSWREGDGWLAEGGR
jgi:hypothetical protein